MKKITGSWVALVVFAGGLATTLRADEVTDWNKIMFQAALVAPATSPLVMSRNAAIVQVSVFEAVNGRYVDRFERRNGVWKISSRVVVLDFLREFEAAPAEVQGIPGLTFGARGSADPSFSVFDSR